MAHYYTKDWVSGGTVPVQTPRVSTGPAIGLTAVLLGLAVLIGILFPATGTFAVEDAVVYVDTGGGHGTGMVIDAKRGYVLTNRHVVLDDNHHARAKTFKLTLYRGTDHPVSVDANLKETSYDWESDDPLAHDWAVLEIDKGEPAKAEVHFADSLQLHTLDKVVAWGFPRAGLATDRCTGKPGSINAIDQVSPGAPYKWIKHDASLAPGNSGGPLTDRNGRVIGMNTAADKVEAGISSGNTNYAIPSHVLKPVLDKYARYTFH